ncbi:nitrogen fixation protein [Rhizobium leguminosarum bv. trifolii]|uniref:nitrogen fixation protein n=1 Tax=Rhizobium leguminosarum TaxID=384 RepID=UPI000E2E88F4|nr:nitrogen fixation protein [Rhizobium leguminosarum]RFB83332.1 nitrogen fixation protein [Rhizobium leguminosarum bv. trifolii]
MWNYSETVMISLFNQKNDGMQENPVIETGATDGIGPELIIGVDPKVEAFPVTPSSLRGNPATASSSALAELITRKPADKAPRTVRQETAGFLDCLLPEKNVCSSTDYPEAAKFRGGHPGKDHEGDAPSSNSSVPMKGERRSVRVKKLDFMTKSLTSLGLAVAGRHSSKPSKTCQGFIQYWASKASFRQKRTIRPPQQKSEALRSWQGRTRCCSRQSRRAGSKNRRRLQQFSSQRQARLTTHLVKPPRRIQPLETARAQSVPPFLLMAAMRHYRRQQDRATRHRTTPARAGCPRPANNSMYKTLKHYHRVPSVEIDP